MRPSRGLRIRLLQNVGALRQHRQLSTDPEPMPLDLSTLPMLALRFRARFAQAAPEPAHAAEMWRGAIKHALQVDQRPVLEALQAPEAHSHAEGGPQAPTNALTPGYVLRVLQPGLDIECEASDQWVCLTLFGRAAMLGLPALHALLRTAQAGIGRDRLEFLLEELQRHGSDGWKPMRIPLRAEALMRQLWRVQAEPIPENSADRHDLLGLQFRRRLVMKERGAPVLERPSLPALVDALCARADRLARVWGEGALMTLQDRAELVQAASSARPVDCGVAPQVQARRMSSSRRGQIVPSVGPTGLFLYALPRAASIRLLPLLRLGAWVHIGQDTTAGAGHYRLLIETC